MTSRRLLRSSCLAAALLLCAAASPATAAQRWRLVPRGTDDPPARCRAGLAGLGDGSVLLSGGCAGHPNCWMGDAWHESLDDTWLWRAGAWSRLAAVLPAIRSSHALARQGTGTALAHGGVGWVGDEQTGHGEYWSDSWRWSGESWQPAASGSAGPGARIDAAMAWNEQRGVAVLFGGSSGGGGHPNDTWEWTPGTGWSLVQSEDREATDRPSGRYGTALASLGGDVLLFGGVSGAGLEPETWAWRCAAAGVCAWVVVDTGGPAPRVGHAMASDPTRGVVVLFGGDSGTSGGLNLRNDTWEWDGMRWQQVSGLSPPSARRYHALAHDDGSGRLVLFGGLQGSSVPPLGDTWVYETLPHDAGPDGGAPDAGSPADAGAPDAGARPDAGPSDDNPDGGDEELRSRYGCQCGSAGPAMPLLLLILGGAAALRRRRAGALLLALALATAAPARAAPRPRLAFLGVSAQAGVAADTTRAISEFAQSELAALRVYDVVGLGEIAELLGLEKRRMLLGCEDDASCIAELGGALGVDRAVTGSLSRIGGSLLLNLSLLDVPRARVVARTGRRLPAGSLDAVLDAVRPALAELAAADGRPVPRLLLLVRGERDFALSGGALGVQGVWEGGRFGASAALLLPVPAVRLEGRVVLPDLGPVRPFVGAGATGFLDALALRAAAGIEVRVRRFVVGADLGAERFLAAPEGVARWSVLVGAAGGMAF